MSTAAAAGADPFDLPRLCRYFSERSPRPMVAVEGPNHVVRYLNPVFARLARKPSKDLLGRPFAETIPEGTGNECLALLDRVFHTGAPGSLPEQEHRQSPPAYWSYEAWAILGADERPVGVMIQVTDATEAAVFRQRATAMNEALVVSSVKQHELLKEIQRGDHERRELEAQMFQAQKMESLGVLAGGIAHDLNNMLAPVLGFAELATECLPLGSPAVPMLEEVEKSARRAADLVNQILAYAGKGRFTIEPVDLSDLVREMNGLLRAAAAINTELKYDLAPALPYVEADATQLRQVVMNLVKNASEAAAGLGAVVVVRTGLVEKNDPGRWFSHPKGAPPDGPSVFLEVADSGCGMTEKVIEKIFDPFFTTKFVGRGLGLAVVLGVVRGHRGALQVRSELSQGSTFRVLLPCSASTVPAPVAAEPSERWRSTGVVLVIDDDDWIRDVAARILKPIGLTVLLAPDGREGLRMCRERGREIDAVLLDLTMPGVSGLEVARTLRTLLPGLPIVLMSGFSVSEVTRQSAGLGIIGFLQKPFDASDLLAAVRSAIGR